MSGGAGQVVGRMMLGTLAVLGACYFGYQFWRSATAEYETQPAVEYLISDTISAKGVAIREEVVLEERAGGNLSYLYTDGTHVSMGMPVAQVVEDAEEITARMKRDALQEEIKSLQSVAGGETMILQADSLVQRVYTDIDTIAAAVAVGDLTAMQNLRYEVLTQLNRRSAATDKEVDFEARIEELQGRIEALGVEEADEESALKAPAPGYFSKKVDGFEGILTPDIVETYTVAEFVDAINAPTPEEPPDSAGKIISNLNWYFAAVIHADEADKFRVGRKVELDFGLAQQKPFLARIERVVTEKGEARAIIVMRCGDMSEELVNLRAHKVDISLNEMYGYKFPTASKRYLGSQLGVYVLDTTIIRFKPVEIIYENEKEGYVVYSMNYKAYVEEDNDPNKRELGLELFDKVIIGGNDLRHGKVLKQ